MSKKLYLIGQTWRSHTVQTCEGCNCDFVHGEKTIQAPVLIFRDDDGARWSLTFWVDETECGSGWTTASIADYSLKKENLSFGEVPVRSGQYIFIQQDDQGSWKIGRKPDFTEADNPVFTYSAYGMDEYYPDGYYTIHAEFVKTARSIPKKPIWVFMGRSGTGKSTLAHELQGRKVLELDADYAYRENWTDYDVIVVGNKYHYTKADIISQLSDDVTPIFVTFE